MLRIALSALYILWIPCCGKAQQLPIGQWRAHLPWTSAIRVVNSPAALWCATPHGLYAIDPQDNSLSTWSTIEGLPATDIRDIAWDSLTSQLVVAHTNGMISLLAGAAVYPLDGFKNSTLAGNKQLYRVYTRNGIAYLAAGVGLVIADLKKRELKTLAIIGTAGEKIKVNDVLADNTYLYAATDAGLKRASLDGTNLSDFRYWQLLSGSDSLPLGPVAHLALVNGKVVASIHDSLYRWEGTLWKQYYLSNKSIRRLTTRKTDLLVCETQNDSGQVTIINTLGTTIEVLRDNYWTATPSDCLWEKGSFWIADAQHGLSKYVNNNYTSYQPNGPATLTSGKMIFQGTTLWVAPHQVSPEWKPLQLPATLSAFADQSWSRWSSREIPLLSGMKDIITLQPDLRNNLIWGGSFGGGLFSIDEKKLITRYTQSSPLRPPPYAPGEYRVTGLTLDADDNLFVANYGAPLPIHVRKKNGEWKSFSPPFSIEDNAVGELLIDDLNQKWILLPQKQGLLCWNHGASIDNPADDRWKWLKFGKGNGNLPDNDVRCLIKDKNNFIWIGTAAGIGIVQCPQDIFTSNGCEALLPVVKQGNFTGYLLQEETVNCIAVDGADRKWIGTRNGAWLLSADGETTIHHFHTGNSPLPDNEVQYIAIDGSRGEVFFETARGICSFRGNATEGSDRYKDVLVFPNPVPPGYTGTIAIRGLVNNAIVKITELDGRLVYETRALGGQAVWNGKNYKGQTIASGVYLVLISDDRQQEKLLTKIVFIGR